MSASRIQRWAVFLSAFNYKIDYIKGKDNVADSFSRLPLKTEQKEGKETNYLNFIENRGIDIDHIKRIKLETARDEILSKVYLAVQSGTFIQFKRGCVQTFR